MDLLEIKNVIEADFDRGDILDKMETDTVADKCTGPEAEEDMKNERFDQVSDGEIQRLIHSQTNSNTRKNTKWMIGTFSKWRAARDNVLCLTEMTRKSLN
jgi:hypothetical protein